MLVLAPLDPFERSVEKLPHNNNNHHNHRLSAFAIGRIFSGFVVIQFSTGEKRQTKKKQTQFAGRKRLMIFLASRSTRLDGAVELTIASRRRSISDESLTFPQIKPGSLRERLLPPLWIHFRSFLDFCSRPAVNKWSGRWLMNCKLILERKASHLPGLSSVPRGHA